MFVKIEINRHSATIIILPSTTIKYNVHEIPQ